MRIWIQCGNGTGTRGQQRRLQRFNRYIDVGRHEFSFRLEVCKETELEKKATAFTQKTYALNFYPHGKGEKKEESLVTLSNENITLSAFRKVLSNTYMVSLVNNFRDEAECVCTVFAKSVKMSFGQYEVKTLLYKDSDLKEQSSMLIL